MEGISREDAKRIGQELDSIKYLECSIEDRLLDECKELPDQQWQTIDEFKSNPVDGWCFLIHSRFNHRTMGNYSIGRFWIDGGICKEENITHVMPIKTPEAPK